MAKQTYTRRVGKAKERVDVYQTVTDRIVGMLESGTVPWRKPWSDTAGGFPLSMSSRKPYRGVNVLLLLMTAMAQGYSSQWWGTYKQIAARGGQVRKGEKGTQVILWKPLIVDDRDKPGKTKQIFILRTFTVFNAEQTDDPTVLGLPVVEKRDPVAVMEECEQAVKAYLNGGKGPDLKTSDTGAWYSPHSDVVNMPTRESFHGSAQYYATLFHELTHSTGHETRLKREGVSNLPSGHKFGDELYSKEELVAEMGASFLAGLTGIATTTLPNSAAYIQSWISVLKGDKQLLVNAASQAQKAVDLILGDSYSGLESDDDESSDE